jgi:hypothetical protein
MGKIILVALTILGLALFMAIFSACNSAQTNQRYYTCNCVDTAGKMQFKSVSQWRGDSVLARVSCDTVQINYNKANLKVTCSFY